MNSSQFACDSNECIFLADLAFNAGNQVSINVVNSSMAQIYCQSNNACDRMSLVLFFCVCTERLAISKHRKDPLWACLYFTAQQKVLDFFHFC